MKTPIIIHATKLIKVSLERFNAKYIQLTIETIGKKGTRGARNGLFILGCVFLNTMTAIDTNTNAVIVPIFTKLANKFKSTNPANKAASIPVTHVLKNGVCKRLWTLESLLVTVHLDSSSKIHEQMQT